MSLYRHRRLAHWPGLLALTYASVTPLVLTGTVQQTMKSVQDVAIREGGRIAYLRPETTTLAEEVQAYIAQYASNVHRMVAMGHIVAGWLYAVDHQADCV